MLVNVSIESHRVRRIRLLVVMLCACVLTPQVRGQQTREEYEKVQNRQTLDLKRMNKSLLKKEIVLGFKGIEDKFRDILRGGTNGRNQKDLAILRQGLEYRIFTLSDSDIQSNPKRFTTANETLGRDLKGAGNITQMPNVQQRQQFRELVFKESMPLLKRLLNEGNFLARTAGLLHLLEMESVPKRGQTRLRMFDAVDEAFLEVLRDPKQPDSVKAVATTGITTYLQKADAVATIELSVAQALVNEIGRPHLSTGYQINLMKALENVRHPRLVAGTKEPLIYCAMTKLMSNQSVDIQARCRAARVMGRAGWDRQVDFDVLAWAVADLTTETAGLFSKAQNKQHVKWARCGWSLYTAFHHETKKEIEGKAPGPLPKGFLNRAPQSKIVRDAYVNGVPVMGSLLSNKQITARQVSPLFKWVAANKPKNLKFDAACPPYVPPGQASVKAQP